MLLLQQLPAQLAVQQGVSPVQRELAFALLQAGKTLNTTFFWAEVQQELPLPTRLRCLRPLLAPACSSNPVPGQAAQAEAGPTPERALRLLVSRQCPAQPRCAEHGPGGQPDPLPATNTGAARPRPGLRTPTRPRPPGRLLPSSGPVPVPALLPPATGKRYVPGRQEPLRGGAGRCVPPAHPRVSGGGTAPTPVPLTGLCRAVPCRAVAWLGSARLVPPVPAAGH